ncbi:uncharacterized protein TM35_000192800 [Trypanosoma theileri]|uniref:Uncharacterized protein n=1 Tax=Trypanosoma theileri TaxID=67003 RepID=A0A1X0NTK0_9TRYP|nr:uncharacterized protein TM35_000192800 [Trypanosoma theileri]ORC88036.1 hypothetical protein TM35_000192800 [Trypanosoma theileri]
MTSSTWALLSRLEVYREAEEQPAPLPPQPYPPLSTNKVLSRRMSLYQKRVKELELENNELRMRFEAVQTSPAAMNTRTSASVLLGCQQILRECCRILQTEGTESHEALNVRSTIVRALEDLFSIRSFCNTFSIMYAEYHQLKKDGIQLVLENYVGDISPEKVQMLAKEILLRFEFLIERVMRSIEEYTSLQRHLCNSLGEVVSCVILHVGRYHEKPHAIVLLTTLQGIVDQTLNLTISTEEDVAGFKRDAGVDETLLRKLHAMSVEIVPQRASLSLTELQTMAIERTKLDLNQRIISYNTLEQSLQRAMAILTDRKTD